MKILAIDSSGLTASAAVTGKRNPDSGIYGKL